jgi:hypothetical protein
MSGPGAPLCRGAAVLRLDGQHTSRFTWRCVSTPPEHAGRDQGGREVKTAAAVLTLCRRCSRGRLGEDGWRGVVVRGDDVPALFLPPCVDVSVRSLLSSGSLVTDGAPVSSAQRGWRRAPSSFPSFSPFASLSSGTGKWGKSPKQMVGDQQGGSGPGCKRPVKAARGQRCRGAWGLDARVR